MGAQPRCSSVLEALVVAVLAFLAAACGSTSISTTSPTDVKCQVSVANSMQSVPFAGATGTLTITTNRECTWSASTTATWVSITPPTTGQGEASLSYRVAANVDPSPRQATMKVNDASVDVAQEAAPCRFTVSPPAGVVPASGGSTSVSVTASSQACAWSATSRTGWITISGAANATGNGTLTVVVGANPGEAREGTIVVAEETVTIQQAAADFQQPAPPSPGPAPAPGPTPPPEPTPPNPTPPPNPPPPPPPAPCTYSVTPEKQTVGAPGGNGSVSVATQSTCAWDATVNGSWITINGPRNGTGNATIAFTAATNTGGARSATMTVNGSSVTITQLAADCSFSIAPNSQSFGAGGGNGIVTVTMTSGANCSWTASTSGSASWISITSGASGNGNGSVGFTVAANNGGERSATMSIAGRTFTVSQAAQPCSYSISPSNQGFPAGGGSGTIAIAATGSCLWNATANIGWISITGPTSGAGSGSTTFAVGANSGAARNGTITIMTQTFTVTQEAAPCSYSVSPPSQAVAPGGGSGSVTITTSAPTCAWSATPDALWIALTSAATGTGNGSVSFTAAPNGGPARSGTLTINGQVATVTQDAAPCSYSIAPSSQTMPASGGSGTVTVAASGTCAWTANSNNTDWLTINSGFSGAGNGSVSFTAAQASGGSSRTGTLTIAGQTFTVIQAADDHHGPGIRN